MGRWMDGSKREGERKGRNGGQSVKCMRKIQINKNNK